MRNNMAVKYHRFKAAWAVAQLVIKHYLVINRFNKEVTTTNHMIHKDNQTGKPFKRGGLGILI